jgi:hypothetical protein
MSESRRSVTDLVGLLSPSLGDEKAREVVTSAAAAIGLHDQVIDRQQALVVLEHIARASGLVGITARFAKTHIHLKW